MKREYELKLEKDKQFINQQNDRMRKTLEDAEREKVTIEIERFKQEQNRMLDLKKVDIDKLN